MSNSNIGGRKEINIINHIFVIRGIVNSVSNGKEPSIHIQIYDRNQASDFLFLEDCMNETFNNLPEEEPYDKLAILYKSNIENQVAVKTSHGPTN